MSEMKNIKIPFLKSRPHVAVLRLQGAISASGRALSDRALAGVIERAFKGKPKAVALEINSPGGSPVQSSLIAARIRRLADEKNIPVVAFVEDVAASGGYWLAAAADEIIIDESSVVGSIGVISAGFGFGGTLEKLGAERRIYTAGASKSMLDPFQDEKPEDVARLKEMLSDIHEIFIEHVKSRRSATHADDADLFTGRVWIGRKAIEVGLADEIGHLVPVMKKRFGEKVRFKRFEQKRPFFARFGAKIVNGTVDAIEERAAFARLGL